MNESPVSKINALILAGKRRSDPFVEVENKAFLELEGNYSINWVIQALNQSQLVQGKPLISVQTSQLALFKGKLKGQSFESIPNDGSPVDAIVSACRSGAKKAEVQKLLITTSDHPLLTAGMIDYFCEQALAQKAELALGVVNGKASPLQDLPQDQRTWHRLNPECWISGANLFLFEVDRLSPKVISSTRLVEIFRKKPLLMTFSLKNLSFICKLVTQTAKLSDCERILSQAFGIKTCLIVLPYAEACIDIDKPSDLELARLLLQQRKSHPER